MSVYLTRINGLPGKDAARYRQQMSVNIAHRLGIKEMGIYRYSLGDESDESLSARVDGIIAGINKGDLVICQFPTGNSLQFERKLIRHLIAYGGRIAIFLQDLELSCLQEMIRLYNQAEIMIVPSLAMRQFLLDNRMRKDMKFVIQEMWDYTCDCSLTEVPSGRKEFVFANVEKLERDFFETAKGKFGLVWYKNAYDRQYMEYGVSFSLAEFLAAGIPVAVPAGISNQELIKENHLGLIVHSPEEAAARIEALEEAEYLEYAQCVERFAPALRKGYYTQRCLAEAMQAFYRKDTVSFSIPAKVYTLGNAVFSSTILKESYVGNLVLSWDFQGKADGFQLYDTAGILIAETNNEHRHYFLIRGYAKESGFLVKAFVETLKGKLIIAESGLTHLDKSVYGIPEVSLIIPAYNAEDYIVRSIDSALAQSFPDLEIIIVDDGSTDRTPDILDWYDETYANVRVVHQENSGTPAARNAGLLQANGKYIGFMDNDDMIRPNMIAKLYHSAKKNRCDIVVTSVYYLTENEYEISIFSQCPLEENAAVDIDKFMDAYYVHAFQFPVVWNKLYRASLVKNRLFPLIIYDDEAWMPYVLSFADRICYLNDGLYEYDRSIRSGTLFNKWGRKSDEEIAANHKRAILFYLENGNPKRREMLKDLAQKELTLFADRYKNKEYVKLAKEIAEM